MKHLKRAKKKKHTLEQSQNSLWKLFEQRDEISVQCLTQTVHLPISSHLSILCAFWSKGTGFIFFGVEKRIGKIPLAKVLNTIHLAHNEWLPCTKHTHLHAQSMRGRERKTKWAHHSGTSMYTHMQTRTRPHVKRGPAVHNSESAQVCRIWLRWSSCYCLLIKRVFAEVPPP